MTISTRVARGITVAPLSIDIPFTIYKCTHIITCASMLTPVGFAPTFPILAIIAEMSNTITLISVLFVNAYAIILTGAGRAFIHVNFTVVVHDVIITAARHAAVDVNIRLHEATQLIDDFSGQYIFVPTP